MGAMTGEISNQEGQQRRCSDGTDDREVFFAQGVPHLAGQCGDHVAPLDCSVNDGCGSVSSLAAVRLASTLNITGTKKSVEKVANTSPPITARPSGAFCSPPSPSPSAIGKIPRIIAVAVMITGRRRVRPASIAALIRSSPSRKRSRPKVTTRMLFALATPILINDPINAGMLSVVPVKNSPQTMPARVPGIAIKMISGTSPD